jgi:hypothetical protein
MNCLNCFECGSVVVSSAPNTGAIVVAPDSGSSNTVPTKTGSDGGNNLLIKGLLPPLLPQAMASAVAAATAEAMRV